MSLIKAMKFVITKTLNYQYALGKTSRTVYTSCVWGLDQRWRKKQGLEENPNAFGPLTNLPDYTFLDGRPTPLGMRQKKRVLKQREMTQKIIKLSSEMDFAVNRHKLMLKDEEEKRQEIIRSKLKPKGHLLLKK